MKKTAFIAVTRKNRPNYVHESTPRTCTRARWAVACQRTHRVPCVHTRIRRITPSPARSARTHSRILRESILLSSRQSACVHARHVIVAFARRLAIVRVHIRVARRAAHPCACAPTRECYLLDQRKPVCSDARSASRRVTHDTVSISVRAA